ncbi:MAG: phage tail tape measure protein [SAR324 cluster bacterium]|nr:phage tail tape measure protein [SAR324 cluster bacterium]
MTFDLRSKITVEDDGTPKLRAFQRTAEQTDKALKTSSKQTADTYQKSHQAIASGGTRTAEQLAASFSKAGRESGKAAEVAAKKWGMAAKDIVIAGRSIQTLVQSSEAVRNSFNRTVDSTKKLDQALAGLRHKNTTLNEIASGLFAIQAVGMLTVGTIRTLTASGIELEKSLSKVAQVGNLQKTSELFSEITEKAKALGSTTAFTAGQVANAFANLIAGGLKAVDSLNAITAALNLAGATSTNIERVGEVIVATLNQFGLMADQADRVSDVFVGAWTTSAANVERLAEGLAEVGPIANAVGMSLENTAATLSLFNDNAIDGSKAGNQLKGILSILTSITPETVEAFGRLKLSVNSFTDESTGKLKTLPEIFGLIRQSVEGLNDVDIQSIMGRIFGRENVASAMVLLNSVKETTKGIEDYARAQRYAISAEESYKAALDNTAGQMSITLSALDAMYEALFQKLRPAVMAVLRHVEDLANSIRDFFESTDNSIVLLRGLGEMMLSLTGTIVLLTTAYKTLVLAKVAYLAVVERVDKAILLFQVGMSQAVIAANALKVALVGLTAGKMALLASGILAVGYAIYETFQQIKKSPTGMEELESSLDKISKMLEGIKILAIGLLQLMTDVFSFNFSGALDRMMATMTAAIANLRKQAEGSGEALVIKDFIDKKALGEIRDLIKELTESTSTAASVGGVAVNKYNLLMALSDRYLKGLIAEKQANDLLIQTYAGNTATVKEFNAAKAKGLRIDAKNAAFAKDLKKYWGDYASVIRSEMDDADRRIEKSNLAISNTQKLIDDVNANRGKLGERFASNSVKIYQNKLDDLQAGVAQEKTYISQMTSELQQIDAQLKVLDTLAPNKANKTAAQLLEEFNNQQEITDELKTQTREVAEQNKGLSDQLSLSIKMLEKSKELGKTSENQLQGSREQTEIERNLADIEERKEQTRRDQLGLLQRETEYRIELKNIDEKLEAARKAGKADLIAGLEEQKRLVTEIHDVQTEMAANEKLSETDKQRNEQLKRFQEQLQTQNYQLQKNLIIQESFIEGGEKAAKNKERELQLEEASKAIGVAKSAGLPEISTEYETQLGLLEQMYELEDEILKKQKERAAIMSAFSGAGAGNTGLLITGQWDQLSEQGWSEAGKLIADAFKRNVDGFDAGLQGSQQGLALGAAGIQAAEFAGVAGASAYAGPVGAVFALAGAAYGVQQAKEEERERKYQETMDRINRIMDTFSAAIGDLEGKFQSIKEAGSSISDRMLEAQNNLRIGAGGAIDDLNSQLKGVIKAGANGFADFSSLITTGFEGLDYDSEAFANAVVKNSELVSDAIMENYKLQMELLNNIKSVLENISSITKDINSIVDTLTKSPLKAAQSAIESTQADIADLVTQIGKKFEGLVSAGDFDPGTTDGVLAETLINQGAAGFEDMGIAISTTTALITKGMEKYNAALASQQENVADLMPDLESLIQLHDSLAVAIKSNFDAQVEYLNLMLESQKSFLDAALTTGIDQTQLEEIFGEGSTMESVFGDFAEQITGIVGDGFEAELLNFQANQYGEVKAGSRLEELNQLKEQVSLIMDGAEAVYNTAGMLVSEAKLGLNDAIYGVRESISSTESTISSLREGLESLSSSVLSTISDLNTTRALIEIEQGYVNQMAILRNEEASILAAYNATMIENLRASEDLSIEQAKFNAAGDNMAARLAAVDARLELSKVKGTDIQSTLETRMAAELAGIMTKAADVQAQLDSKAYKEAVRANIEGAEFKEDEHLQEMARIESLAALTTEDVDNARKTTERYNAYQLDLLEKQAQEELNAIEEKRGIELEYLDILHDLQVANINAEFDAQMKAIQEQSDSQSETLNNFRDFVDSMFDLNKSIEEKIFEASLNDSTGSVSAESLASSLSDLQAQYASLDTSLSGNREQANILLNRQVDVLEQQYEQGFISTDQYVFQLQQLQGEIGNLVANQVDGDASLTDLLSADGPISSLLVEVRDGLVGSLGESGPLFNLLGSLGEDIAAQLTAANDQMESLRREQNIALLEQQIQADAELAAKNREYDVARDTKNNELAKIRIDKQVEQQNALLQQQTDLTNLAIAGQTAAMEAQNTELQRLLGAQNTILDGLKTAEAQFEKDLIDLMKSQEERRELLEKIKEDLQKARDQKLFDLQAQTNAALDTLNANMTPLIQTISGNEADTTITDAIDTVRSNATNGIQAILNIMTGYQTSLADEKKNEKDEDEEHDPWEGSILKPIVDVFKGFGFGAKGMILPSHAVGGILEGPSHAQGGIKVQNKDGVYIAEVEGGEGVIPKDIMKLPGFQEFFLQLLASHGKNFSQSQQEGKFEQGGILGKALQKLATGGMTADQAISSDLLSAISVAKTVEELDALASTFDRVASSFRKTQDDELATMRAKIKGFVETFDESQIVSFQPLVDAVSQAEFLDQGLTIAIDDAQLRQSVDDALELRAVLVSSVETAEQIGPDFTLTQKVISSLEGESQSAFNGLAGQLKTFNTADKTFTVKMDASSVPTSLDISMDKETQSALEKLVDPGIKVTVDTSGDTSSGTGPSDTGSTITIPKYDLPDTDPPDPNLNDNPPPKTDPLALISGAGTLAGAAANLPPGAPEMLSSILMAGAAAMFTAALADMAGFEPEASNALALASAIAVVVGGTFGLAIGFLVGGALITKALLGDNATDEEAIAVGIATAIAFVAGGWMVAAAALIVGMIFANNDPEKIMQDIEREFSAHEEDIKKLFLFILLLPLAPLALALDIAQKSPTFDTIQEEIDKLIAKVIGSLMPNPDAFKDIDFDVLNIITSNLKGLESFFSDIDVGLNPLKELIEGVDLSFEFDFDVLNIITSNLKGLESFFSDIDVALNPLKDFVLEFDYVNALTVNLGNFGEALSDLDVGLNPLKDVFSQADIDVLNALTVNLENFGKMLSDLDVALNPLKDTITEFDFEMPDLSQFGGPEDWIKELGNWISGIGTSIGDLGAMMDFPTLTQASQAMQLLGRNVGSVFSTFGNIISSIFGGGGGEEKAEGGPIDTYQTGGLLVGPSHKHGGIPAYVKASRGMVELEGGEYIIKKATVNRIGASRLGRLNKTGTFADGGLIPKFEEGGGVPAEASAGGSGVIPGFLASLSAPLTQMQASSATVIAVVNAANDAFQLVIGSISSLFGLFTGGGGGAANIGSVSVTTPDITGAVQGVFDVLMAPFNAAATFLQGVSEQYNLEATVRNVLDSVFGKLSFDPSTFSNFTENFSASFDKVGALLSFDSSTFSNIQEQASKALNDIFGKLSFDASTFPDFGAVARKATDSFIANFSNVGGGIDLGKIGRDIVKDVVPKDFQKYLPFGEGGIIPIKMAMGGPIAGNSVELEGGEYILRKSAVSRLGVENLDFMNNTGRVPKKYAAGGIVANGDTGGAGTTSVDYNVVNNLTVAINNNGEFTTFKVSGDGGADEIVQAIIPKLQSLGLGNVFGVDVFEDVRSITEGQEVYR